MPDWLRRHGVFVAVLLIAAGAYVAMSATTVLWHDHGEYVVVAHRGGVPHPPGYPLYVLWLRAWSWLPASTPVAATSYATVLLGIGALWLLYRGVLGFYVARPAAAAAVALFGLSSRAGLSFTHAENLALNAAIAAAMIWVAAPRTRLGAPGRKSLVLAGLMGLGLANHHTIVLMSPLVGWAAVRDLRRLERPIVAVGGMVGLAVVGLSPYLMLLGEPPAGAWVWGRFEGLGDVADHFFRTEYGLALAPQQDANARWLDQWVFLLGTLARDSLWGFGLLGLGALGAALAALRRGMTRRAAGGAIALAVTFLTTGPLFVAVLNVSPEGITGYEVARFHLLPSMVLSVFVGRGLHQAWRRWVRLRPLWAGLPVILAALAALFTAPDVAVIHRPTVEHYLRNTLTTLPPDAVILTSGDHRLFGYLYLQRVVGLREDVTVVSPTMLFRPWYRRQSEVGLGRELPMVGESTLDMVGLADVVLGTARPLYLGNVGVNYAPILAAFPNRPYGALVQIDRPGTASPTVEELQADTEALFAQYTLEDAAPRDPYGIGPRVFATYARPWHYLAATYAEQGRRERAQAAEQRAAAFSP